MRLLGCKNYYIIPFRPLFLKRPDGRPGESLESIPFYGSFQRFFSTHKSEFCDFLLIFLITNSDFHDKKRLSSAENLFNFLLSQSMRRWKNSAFAYTVVNFFRPTRRRFLITFCPSVVLMRFKKPCRRDLLRLFGWYVFFDIRTG